MIDPPHKFMWGVDKIPGKSILGTKFRSPQFRAVIASKPFCGALNEKGRKVRLKKQNGF